MHKYIMNIIVSQPDTGKKILIPLPETTFIAVTTYHNVELIKLKIARNPSFVFEQMEEAELSGKDALVLSPPTTIQNRRYSSSEGDTLQAEDSVSYNRVTPTSITMLFRSVVWWLGVPKLLLRGICM